MISRSDSEPAILALKEAVRGESDADIVLEEVPVGDHQANELMENAVKNVQGQFRVHKDALESEHERRVDGEGPLMENVQLHHGRLRVRPR